MDPMLPVIRQTPSRIVCLTEETTELLYALGEEERIVGITAYTERPARARAEKPVVSAFVGGSLERIQRLQPDLVIGFSDVQADWARTLIHAGLPVLIFNQRRLQEIIDVLMQIGSLIGRAHDTRKLLDSWLSELDALARDASRRVAERGSRPRVYFEEWDDPMISGIHWVHELISLAGGENIFAERATSAASAGRQCTVEEVRERAPHVILASWCGKPFDAGLCAQRLGSTVPAVAAGRLHALDSATVLQPGPACLTDGAQDIFRAVWNLPPREQPAPHTL
jgi:iron complex transport system substrate-binding protein